MISYDCNISKNGNTSIGDFSFKGLSTDTKPTETHDGITIKNGSSFLEIDTKTLFFYDSDSDAWV